MRDLTPELTALVAAAKPLSSELVRQVTDYAEFLGHRHGRSSLAARARVPDDDEVDLGGPVGKGDALDLSGVFDSPSCLSLSGIYINQGMHSAIGIV